MRQLITFACLLLATALYYAGMEADAAFVVGLGTLSEYLFWKRLPGRRRD